MELGELTTYFTRLYDEYRLLVYNRIHQFVPDSRICEELVQDTFLKAWVALPQLRAESNPRGWLYIIASNIARDYYRMNRRKDDNQLPLELWYSDSVTPNIAETYELSESTVNALLAMTDEDRTLLYLYTVYGVTSDELARALHQKRKSVLNTISRCRITFRKHYHEQAS